MKLLERVRAVFNDVLRRHRQVREAPPWLISLVLHLVVILVLAGFTTTVRSDQRGIETTAVVNEIPPDLRYDDPTEYLAAPSAANDHASALAIASIVGDNSAPPEVETFETMLEPELTVPEFLEVPEAEVVMQHVAQLGTATAEHAQGVNGAIDRLTYEILESLRERPTLVAWLFDASGSLNDERRQILERFETVYEQLGALEPESIADEELMTAVVAFGQNYLPVTGSRPTNDIVAIQQAVQNIQVDQSGRENTFSSVIAAIQQFNEYRRANQMNFMIIIVTDERGDDVQVLEAAIDIARRQDVPCYVVGHAAPFGRQQSFVTVPYPPEIEAQYGPGSWQRVPMDAGPESYRAERVRLSFWGGGGGRQYDEMSSGFGPYGLSRLCAETGGIYFITQQEGGPEFDPLVMRRYHPDYCSTRDYEAFLAGNAAARALVDAAERTAAEDIINPQLVFSAVDDNTLRTELSNGQMAAARFEAALNPMLNILSQGERDRERLTAPRWQAAYDLALGRALAMRVRTFGYNMVLAQMKTNPLPFQDPDNNEWRLVPDDRILAGAQVERAAEQARMYLQRVIDEHPGTPWAMLAQVELRQPFGWRWEEGYRPPPPPPAMDPGNNNPPNPNQPNMPAPAPPPRPQI